jgi:hypothetical protein
MHNRRKVLTNSDISLSNWGKKDYVQSTLELADNLNNDPNNKDRLKENLCLVCYYRTGGLTTNAFIHTNCRSCNTSLHFAGSSSVEELCLPCAKEHKLCVKCGADIEYKERKKDRIFDKFVGIENE